MEREIYAVLRPVSRRGIGIIARIYPVREDLSPIAGLEKVHYLIRRVTYRIKTGYEPAYACTADEIDRNLLFLKILQHAGFRRALRTSATEHDRHRRTSAGGPDAVKPCAHAGDEDGILDRLHAVCGQAVRESLRNGTDAGGAHCGESEHQRLKILFQKILHQCKCNEN